MDPCSLGEMGWTTREDHCPADEEPQESARMITRLFLTGLTLTVYATAGPLPRSHPEAQGVSSESLSAFIAAANEWDAIHSFMCVRHGHVIAEAWWAPFESQARHKLYSLSKSFASTAVGIAIAEGKLTLHDPVIDFFPDEVPEDPSYNLKSMRVRDLLSMSTGQIGSDLKEFTFDSEESLTKAFLALPVEHKPGTHFLYNTPATFMCSAIVQKVTGETLLDYLGPRLFEPLGIEEPAWESSAQGISLGGYGLSVRTEDIAKLGQLYLQGGEWEGKRLLTKEWVEAATSKQTSNGSDPENDWDQGYGFQFWRCRHGAYRGDGAFGQFCVVMPEQDAVIAITSGTGNMGGVLELIWKHLLPAMAPVALDANPHAHQKLLKQGENLTLPTPDGEPDSPSRVEIEGNRYTFMENEPGLQELRLNREGTAWFVDLKLEDQEHSLQFGSGKWIKSRTSFGPKFISRGLNREIEPIAASAAWSDASSFVGKIWYTETPYALTLTLRFDEDSVRVEPEWNVAFGRKRLNTLVGKLVE